MRYHSAVRLHRRALIVLLFLPALFATNIKVPGLEQPVEILRDRWGVPHIYARTANDLFFAQGYITGTDRLWQIDLWRRIGTGKLAEALGPSAIDRDRLARAVNYRGPWEAEWSSYSPDTKAIVTAFVAGINAYIQSLGGKRPLEFQIAGYDPGLWVPQDCLSRVAGLLMTRNLTREINRAVAVRRFGLPKVQKLLPVDPQIPLTIPDGLDLADITPEMVRVYNQAIGPARFAEQGSNNWVIDGTMTTTGKPILANDPHRPVQIPSLRKTVHLVGPGWNAIGAGEPALPGIALGHNEHIGFGFTIVGIDQQDLYVEKLNPANADEYRHKGAWKKMDVERQTLAVRGRAPLTIDLRYTVHGPLIHEDRTRHRAYALRWVGSEPGTAGYLAGLALARAHNWEEFLRSLERYRVPSENVVYADTAGNIGWQAAGLTPVRQNWTGLLPVPGDSGGYEWSGFRALADLPRAFNPPSHFIATANNNILPDGYSNPPGYEWALPFRVQRIREMLSSGRKMSVKDCEQMQQDVTSIPARRFQAIVRRWSPKPAGRPGEIVERLLQWDARLTADSAPALIYEVWMAHLPKFVFGAEMGALTDLKMLLETLENSPNPKALAQSLDASLEELDRDIGTQIADWKWGRMHQILFEHPLGRAKFNRGPIARPGDGNTVNATSGAGFRQTNGASYRQILDLSDWDHSVMTNVPGESGNLESPHYSDLLDEWATGGYHPMPYSRKAVEAATVERIMLVPK